MLARLSDMDMRRTICLISLEQQPNVAEQTYSRFCWIEKREESPYLKGCSSRGTGLAMLGCNSREADCLCMLLDHAQRSPQQGRLVAAALSAVAATLNYPSRGAYTRQLAWPFVECWLNRGSDLWTLLDVKVHHKFATVLLHI